MRGLTTNSRWGPQDEIGAMNLVHPKSVAAAAKLAVRGKVYSLSHVLEDGMPLNWFHQDFVYSTFRSVPEMLAKFDGTFANKNRISFMNMRMEMADHSGTHIDGLNHAAIGYRLYNHVDARKVTGTRGTSRLGMETMPPLISRGVLADMTLLRRYGPGETIQAADIRRVLKLEGVKIGQGDSLLLFTGWEEYWRTDNKKYLESMPGIGVGAAEWLVGKDVVAVGSDTQSVEVEPNEDPDSDAVVHQILIVKNGIHLIENLRLSHLAKSKSYEFMFICLPLKISGGTGSPVNPVAVT